MTLPGIAIWVVCVMSQRPTAFGMVAIVRVANHEFLDRRELTFDGVEPRRAGASPSDRPGSTVANPP